MGSRTRLEAGPVSEEREEKDRQCQICRFIEESGAGETAIELATGSVCRAGRSEVGTRAGDEEGRMPKFESGRKGKVGSLAERTVAPLRLKLYERVLGPQIKLKSKL